MEESRVNHAYHWCVNLKETWRTFCCSALRWCKKKYASESEVASFCGKLQSTPKAKGKKKRQYYDSYQDVVLRQCRKEILPAYGYTVFVHGRAQYLLSSVVQTSSMSYYLWKCMLKLGLLILSLILAFSLFLTPFPHSSDRKFSENVGKCCLFFFF